MPSELFATDDVEAFLEGLSVEWFKARGAIVPTWAWVNRAAHARPSALVDLADPAIGATGPGPDAVRAIATELLERSKGDDDAVEQLQRSVLVPLELALLDGRVEPVTMARLVMAIRTALRSGRCPRAWAPPS